MTIFVTWQLRVTLDSIRNSCDVFSLKQGIVFMYIVRKISHRRTDFLIFHCQYCQWVCYLLCKQSCNDDSESETEYRAHRAGRLERQSAGQWEPSQPDDGLQERQSLQESQFSSESNPARRWTVSAGVWEYFSHILCLFVGVYFIQLQ